MLNSIQKAFKVKEVRERLLYTFMMLIVIRIGSCLPIPGVDASFLKEFFTNLQNSGMGFVNAITGGSFSNMSLFALSITPYITSSIIMQLMTIAIPKLEEMQKEGEDGRKKIAEYTRYLTVALALFQSSAMAIGFGKQGLLYEDAQNVWGYMTVIAAMTAGSALLMWIGERITEKGVGNGISIVLLINIVSSLPQDVLMLYERFMAGKSVAVATVAAIIVLAVVVATVVFVLVLNGAERRHSGAVLKENAGTQNDRRPVLTHPLKGQHCRRDPCDLCILDHVHAGNDRPVLQCGLFHIWRKDPYGVKFRQLVQTGNAGLFGLAS